jgi:hypothetical protein
MAPHQSRETCPARKVAEWVVVVLVSMTAAAMAGNTGMDPNNRFAWAENVGWANAANTNQGVSLHYDGDSGFLIGYAWGENIGWIKFSGTSPDYGVRALAFDTQPHGTPNWWLDHHSVSESDDAGDGVPAWRKYVMDTDPNVMGDYLHITDISFDTSARPVVAFTPTSVGRYYTLVKRAGLTQGSWSNVASQVSVQFGSDGQQHMKDKGATPSQQTFYSIRVSVAP